MSLTLKKSFSIALSICYFTTQIALGSVAESRFWAERRKAVVSHEPKSSELSSQLTAHGSKIKDSTQLASLPTLFNQLPSASAALPSLPKWSASNKLESMHLSKSLQELVANVPLSHGSIQDIYSSGDENQRPVLLLQDVHLNAEAQTNIATVLQELIDKKQVGFVGVEGAFAPFPFEPFRKLPNKQITRNVVQAFLNKNMLAAPSFVGITSPVEPPLFMGVDDRAHYDANVKAYLESRPLKKKVAEQLDRAKRELNEKKLKVFSAELKHFDDLRTAYRKGDVGLGAYVKKLLSRHPRVPLHNDINAGTYSKRYESGDPGLEPVAKKGLQSGFPIKAFGNDDKVDLVLQQFLSAYSMEQSLDFAQVERERRVVIENLTKVLSEQETSMLVGESLAYRMGRLSFGDYYQGLKNLCETHGIALSNTPAFETYIRYVLLADGIKASALFESVSKLEREILGSLIKTPEEKSLAEASEHLTLTEKLIEFALTPEEWEKYRAQYTVHSTQFKEILDPFENFYREADIRSGTMVENLLKDVHRTPFTEHGTMKNLPRTVNRAPCTVNASVLVVGGFHTPKITQLLRDQKISHVVVSPKLAKIDEKSAGAYLSVFAREKTPLDKLLQGEKLFLSPESQNITAQTTFVRDYAIANSIETGALDVAVPMGEGTLEAHVDIVDKNDPTTARVHLTWRERLRRFIRRVLPRREHKPESPTEKLQGEARYASLVREANYLEDDGFLDEAAAKYQEALDFAEQNLQLNETAAAQLRRTIDRIQNFQQPLGKPANENDVTPYLKFADDVTFQNTTIAHDMRAPGIRVVVLRQSNPFGVSWVNHMVLAFRVDATGQQFIAARAHVTQRADGAFENPIEVTFVKNKGYLQQTITALLLSNKIPEWRSATSNLRQPVDSRMYQRMQRDRQLLITYENDRYIVRKNPNPYPELWEWAFQAPTAAGVLSGLGGWPVVLIAAISSLIFGFLLHRHETRMNKWKLVGVGVLLSLIAITPFLCTDNATLATVLGLLANIAAHGSYNKLARALRSSKNATLRAVGEWLPLASTASNSDKGSDLRARSRFMLWYVDTLIEEFFKDATPEEKMDRERITKRLVQLSRTGHNLTRYPALFDAYWEKIIRPLERLPLPERARRLNMLLIAEVGQPVASNVLNETLLEQALDNQLAQINLTAEDWRKVSRGRYVPGYPIVLFPDDLFPPRQSGERNFQEAIAMLRRLNGKSGIDPANFLAAIESIVLYENPESALHGFTEKVSSTIHLNAARAPAEIARTLMHEGSHLLDRPRLARLANVERRRNLTVYHPWFAHGSGTISSLLSELQAHGIDTLVMLAVLNEARLPNQAAKLNELTDNLNDGARQALKIIDEQLKAGRLSDDEKEWLQSVQALWTSIKSKIGRQDPIFRQEVTIEQELIEKAQRLVEIIRWGPRSVEDTTAVLSAFSRDDAAVQLLSGVRLTIERSNQMGLLQKAWTRIGLKLKWLLIIRRQLKVDPMPTFRGMPKKGPEVVVAIQADGNVPSIVWDAVVARFQNGLGLWRRPVATSVGNRLLIRIPEDESVRRGLPETLKKIFELAPRGRTFKVAMQRTAPLEKGRLNSTQLALARLMAEREIEKPVGSPEVISQTKGTGGTASILDPYLKRIGFDSVHPKLHALYTALGVNWEIVFQWLIPALTFVGTLLFPSFSGIIYVAWGLSAATFAGFHRGRSPPQKFILLLIGLGLGSPFVFGDLNFLSATLLAMLFHSIYNALVLFTPLGRILPVANVLSEEKDFRYLGADEWLKREKEVRESDEQNKLRPGDLNRLLHWIAKGSTMPLDVKSKFLSIFLRRLEANPTGNNATLVVELSHLLIEKNDFKESIFPLPQDQFAILDFLEGRLRRGVLGKPKVKRIRANRLEFLIIRLEKRDKGSEHAALQEMYAQKLPIEEVRDRDRKRLVNLLWDERFYDHQLQTLEAKKAVFRVLAAQSTFSADNFEKMSYALHDKSLDDEAQEILIGIFEKHADQIRRLNQKQGPVENFWVAVKGLGQEPHVNGNLKTRITRLVPKVGETNPHQRMGKNAIVSEIDRPISEETKALDEIVEMVTNDLPPEEQRGMLINKLRELDRVESSDPNEYAKARVRDHSGHEHILALKRRRDSASTLTMMFADFVIRKFTDQRNLPLLEKEDRKNLPLLREMDRLLPGSASKSGLVFTFDELVDDLFGFSSRTHGLIALYNRYVQHNPAAIFHEAGHFLMGDDPARPRFLQLEIVTRGEQKLLAVRTRNSIDEDFDVFEYRLISDSLLEFIKQENWPAGWEKDPHYLLRVLQRDIFGLIDHDLSTFIKAEQIRMRIAKEGMSVVTEDMIETLKQGGPVEMLSGKIFFGDWGELFLKVLTEIAMKGPGPMALKAAEAVLQMEPSRFTLADIVANPSTPADVTATIIASVDGPLSTYLKVVQIKAALSRDNFVSVSDDMIAILSEACLLELDLRQDAQSTLAQIAQKCPVLPTAQRALTAMLDVVKKNPRVYSGNDFAEIAVAPSTPLQVATRIATVMEKLIDSRDVNLQVIASQCLLGIAQRKKITPDEIHRLSNRVATTAIQRGAVEVTHVLMPWFREGLATTADLSLVAGTLAKTTGNPKKRDALLQCIKIGTYAATPRIAEITAEAAAEGSELAMEILAKSLLGSEESNQPVVSGVNTQFLTEHVVEALPIACMSENLRTQRLAMELMERVIIAHRNMLTPLTVERLAETFSSDREFSLAVIQTIQTLAQKFPKPEAYTRYGTYHQEHSSRIEERFPAYVKISRAKGLLPLVLELKEKGNYSFNTVDVDFLADCLGNPAQIQKDLEALERIRQFFPEYRYRPPRKRPHDGNSLEPYRAALDQIHPQQFTEILGGKKDAKAEERLKGFLKACFSYLSIPEQGMEFEGQSVTVDSLTESVLNERRFRIPGYFKDYFDALAAHVQQLDTGAFASLTVDPQQSERWSYENTRDEDIATFLSKPGFSGHFAMHQIHVAEHQKKDSVLVEAILQAGYLISTNVFEVLNERNIFQNLLAAGKVNALGATEFVHFSIDEPISYLSTPYAVVYPVEVLLENQAFVGNPLTTNDWRVGGFSPNVEHPSHRLSVENGILLLPKSQQTEWEAVFKDFEQRFPNWRRPKKIFFYDGKNAGEGLEELKNQFAPTNPVLKNPASSVAVSRPPRPLRRLNGGMTSGMLRQCIKDVQDKNGIIHYGEQTKLAKRAQVQDFSYQLEKLAQGVLDQNGIGMIEDVTDTGSSKRGTYQERHKNFPDDFDLMVKVNGRLPSNAELQRYVQEFAAQVQSRVWLQEIYGSETAYTIEPELDANKNVFLRPLPEGGILVKLKIFAGKERNIPVLTIDTVFFNTEKMADGLRYQKKVAGDLVDGVVQPGYLDMLLPQNLSDAEKEEGRQHILSVIRSLKALFKEEGVYTRLDGGLRGVGTEQLVLQLNGVEDEFGRPKPVQNLQELKQVFSVSNAMKKLEDAMFDAEGNYVGSEGFRKNLPLWDPGALTPTPLTSDVTEGSMIKFADVAWKWTATTQANPPARQGSNLTGTASILDPLFRRWARPGTWAYWTLTVVVSALWETGAFHFLIGSYLGLNIWTLAAIFSFTHTIVEWIARAKENGWRNVSTWEFVFKDSKDFALRFGLSLLFSAPFLLADASWAQQLISSVWIRQSIAIAITFVVHAGYNGLVLKLRSVDPEKYPRLANFVNWLPLASIFTQVEPAKTGKVERDFLLERLARVISDKLVHLSDDEVLRYLNAISGDHLSADDFTGRVKLSYHAQGSHKQVFKIVFELRNNHQPFNVLLALKDPKETGAITEQEMTALQVLSRETKHLPLFGEYIDHTDAHGRLQFYVEEFIKGPTARELQKQGVFNIVKRSFAVRALLSVSLLMGDMPKDIHANNLILTKKNEQPYAVVVDIGNKRMPLDKALLRVIAFYGYFGNNRGSNRFIFRAFEDIFSKEPVNGRALLAKNLHYIKEQIALEGEQGKEPGKTSPKKQRQRDARDEPPLKPEDVRKIVAELEEYLSGKQTQKSPETPRGPPATRIAEAAPFSGAFPWEIIFEKTVVGRGTDELAPYLRQIEVVKGLIENTSKKDMVEIIREVSQNQTITEEDLTGQVTVSYVDKGRHKYVFKVVVHTQKEDIPILLAAKIGQGQNAIGDLELLDLKRLAGRGVPRFGKHGVTAEGRVWFVEQFIEGQTALAMEAEGKLSKDIRRAVVGTLLGITLALGRTPADIHAKNFIIQNNNQPVMVDIGSQRLDIIGKKKNVKHQLVLLALTMAHYGYRTGNGSDDFIFDQFRASLGEEGTRLLADVHAACSNLGAEKVRNYLYKKGHNHLFVLHDKTPISQKALVDRFTTYFIKTLETYLTKNGLLRGPPEAPPTINAKAAPPEEGKDLIAYLEKVLRDSFAQVGWRIASVENPEGRINKENNELEKPISLLKDGTFGKVYKIWVVMNGEVRPLAAKIAVSNDYGYSEFTIECLKKDVAVFDSIYAGKRKPQVPVPDGVHLVDYYGKVVAPDGSPIVVLEEFVEGTSIDTWIKLHQNEPEKTQHVVQLLRSTLEFFSRHGFGLWDLGGDSFRVNNHLNQIDAGSYDKVENIPLHRSIPEIIEAITKVQMDQPESEAGGTAIGNATGGEASGGLSFFPDWKNYTENWAWTESVYVVTALLGIFIFVALAISWFSPDFIQTIFSSPLTHYPLLLKALAISFIPSVIWLILHPIIDAIRLRKNPDLKIERNHVAMTFGVILLHTTAFAAAIFLTPHLITQPLNVSLLVAVLIYGAAHSVGHFLWNRYSPKSWALTFKIKSRGQATNDNRKEIKRGRVPSLESGLLDAVRHSRNNREAAVQEILTLAQTEKIFWKRGAISGLNRLLSLEDVRAQIDILVRESARGDKESQRKLADLFFSLRFVLSNSEYTDLVEKVDDLFARVKQTPNAEDIFVMLDADANKARAQIKEWSGAQLPDGKRIVFMAPNGASMHEFRNLDDGQRIFVRLVTDRALTLISNVPVPASEKTQRRFIVEQGQALPADYFDLSGASEDLKQAIVVNIILSQLGLALELKGSLLPDWQKFRRALVAA